MCNRFALTLEISMKRFPIWAKQRRPPSVKHRCLTYLLDHFFCCGFLLKYHQNENVFVPLTNVSQNCLYILKTETISSNWVLNPSNCPNNVFLNSGGWFSKQSRTCACPFSNPKDAFGIVSTNLSSWLLF